MKKLWIGKMKLAAAAALAACMVFGSVPTIGGIAYAEESTSTDTVWEDGDGFGAGNENGGVTGNENSGNDNESGKIKDTGNSSESGEDGAAPCVEEPRGNGQSN